MPDTQEAVTGSRDVPERRSHPRHEVRSLAYIELDEGNGGILLNVSESGLAVQAVTPLIDEFLPRMRLQLSQTAAPIAAVGQIVWTANSKKVAGIRFLDFSPDAANQVKEWIASEDFPLIPSRESNFPREAPASIEEFRADEPAAVESDIVAHTASDSAKEADAFAVALDSVSEPATESASIPLEVVALTTEKSFKEPETAARPAVDFRKDAVIKTEAPPAILSALQAESARSSWLLYALIGILAICSTAAGWSVGKTGLYGALAKFRPLHSDVGTPDAVTSSPAATANLPGIEVVDLNDRRWYVPFAGGAVSAPVPQHPQLVVSQPPSRQRESVPARTLSTLADSRPTAAKPRVAETEAPPTLSNQPSGIAASGASLASISGDSNIPPELPVGVSPQSAVVEPAQLIHRVEPVYPTDAGRLYSTDATVKMHVTIGADGLVQTVKLVSGPPLFFPAAEAAIHKWRYRPALINGKPSVSDGEVAIVFRHP